MAEGDADRGPEVYRLARALTAEAARAAVERALSAPVAELRPSAVGASHAVWFATLAGGRRCVARFATHPEHDLAREVWATETARAAGVPTPRLLAADLAPADGSPPLVVQEHVAGEPGHRAALDPGERAAVLAEMGALAARIHAIALPGAGQLRAVGAGYAGTSRSWAAFTVEALERRLGELAALGDETVPREVADGIRRRFASGQPALEAAVPTGAPTSALLHADFRLENAIVARDAAGVARVAAVLDFEMAMCGDGAVDLAWLTYQDARGPADAAAILRGYGVAATATGLRERLRLYQLHYALGHLWWKASFRDGPGAEEVIDRIRRLLAGRD